MLQTPQVFPDFNWIIPFSPHPFPQEFLIHQFPPTTPTKVTPWLSWLPQLLNTPLLYDDQFEASTATETTLALIALVKSLQFLTSVNPDILNGPVLVLHACCLGTYGY